MSFGQALSVSPIEIARAVGGIANGGVMMTPHFYKSSKGDEKDWGEGERAISEDAASQVTSCMQTVVSEERALAARLTAMTWRVRPVRPNEPTRTAATSRRTTCRPLWLCAGTIAQGAVLYHARSERRAAQIPLRCRSSPLWPMRSTLGIRTRSGVTIFGAWFVVPYEVFTCPAPRMRGAGIQYADSIIRFTGAAMIETSRQQPRGRNRGPNRDGEKPRVCAAGVIDSRQVEEGTIFVAFPVKTSTAMILLPVPPVGCRRRRDDA